LGDHEVEFEVAIGQEAPQLPPQGVSALDSDFFSDEDAEETLLPLEA
jgi:hypothetical protein